MGTPGATDTEPDTEYQRLESQIRWYDSKSAEAQWRYKVAKIAEICAGATVPAIASASPRVTAGLGVFIVAIEGLIQLNQWQHNWITYRSTCEALRHEKYAYLGRSGSYDGLDDSLAKKALVERVESLISTEHSKWISRQEYQGKKAGAQLQSLHKE